jgi:hypothetical protein
MPNSTSAMPMISRTRRVPGWRRRESPAQDGPAIRPRHVAAGSTSAEATPMPAPRPHGSARRNHRPPHRLGQPAATGRLPVLPKHNGPRQPAMPKVNVAGAAHTRCLRPRHTGQRDSAGWPPPPHHSVEISSATDVADSRRSLVQLLARWQIIQNPRRVGTESVNVCNICGQVLAGADRSSSQSSVEPPCRKVWPAVSFGAAGRVFPSTLGGAVRHAAGRVSSKIVSAPRGVRVKLWVENRPAATARSVRSICTASS